MSTSWEHDDASHPAEAAVTKLEEGGEEGEEGAPQHANDDGAPDNSQHSVVAPLVGGAAADGPEEEGRGSADVLDRNPVVSVEEVAVHEPNPPESYSEGGESVNEEDDQGEEGEDDDDDDEEEDDGEEEVDPSQQPEYPPPPPPPIVYEGYPPPPPGYYPPPPPGYPPYPPPPPGYGYPPPPPGYYPPPPPGYYPPPPGYPGPPPDERDPNGNYFHALPPPPPGAPPLHFPPKRRHRERIKTPADIEQRKLRKNAQSRHRAAKLRDRVEKIKTKGAESLSREEEQLYQTVEGRRTKKNARSKERALEKKAEIERIESIPEAERTLEERETLEVAMAAKRRKNEGDRLRRERLKKLGMKVKPPGMKIVSRPMNPEEMYPFMNSAPSVAPSPPVVATRILPSGEVVPGHIGAEEDAAAAGGPVHDPPLIHDGNATGEFDLHAYPDPVTYYAEPPAPAHEDEDEDDKNVNNENGDHEKVILPSASKDDELHHDHHEVSDMLLQDAPIH